MRHSGMGWPNGAVTGGNGRLLALPSPDLLMLATEGRSGDVSPDFPPDYLPNGPTMQAIPARQSTHRIAGRVGQTDHPYIGLGDFCVPVPLPASYGFGVGLRPVTVTPRCAFWVGSEALPISCCLPALGYLVQHIGDGIPNPEVASSLIEDASDLICTDLVITDAAWRIAGMQRMFCALQRSSERNGQRQTIRSVPLAEPPNQPVPTGVAGSGDDPTSFGLAVNSLPESIVDGKICSHREVQSRGVMPPDVCPSRGYRASGIIPCRN